MRRIGLADLHHAARAVQGVPVQARARFCQQLLWQAHVADKYVKRLRKLHPDWGDGSLRAAARAHICLPEVSSGAAELLPCLATVLDAVRIRNADRTCHCDQGRVCMVNNKG